MTKEFESITSQASIKPGRVASLIGVLLLTTACNSEPSSASASTSASAKAVASAPGASSSEAVAKLAGGVPIAPTQIERIVNPKRQPAYTGAVGSVAGSVSIVGDESPIDPKYKAEEIPADCLAARETYKNLFREGLMRSAADVFVAVTGYDGYLPAAKDTETVNAASCAFDTRTLGLTFGQALDIVSKDRRSYVPELLGARATAQLVATPGGEPVRLYPQRPGRYVLVDSMRTFATAEVMVVAYRTFDVTGLDGKFEIKDIPVGKVKLNALLPAAMLTSGQEITIEAGKTTTVELELKFDKKVYAEQQAQKKASAPAAPVKPAAAASK